MTIVNSIYNSPSHLNRNTSGKLLFRFEHTKEAALHNTTVLQCYNFNLDDAIQAQNDSPVSYGSEFRPISELSKLLNQHPLWGHILPILSRGATFPLLPIPDSICHEDINFHKEHGNHMSSLLHSDTIQLILQEDVERGFALILPIELLPHIPQASLAPLGCQEQTTLNMRVDHTNLPPCMYGYCLRRTIHYILHLRQHHPQTNFFINKFDYDAAYR